VVVSRIPYPACAHGAWAPILSAGARPGCRCAKKDTVEILAKLQGCFPFAKNEDEGNVQKLLGPINQSVMARAIAAVEAGDPETLGKLMTEAQVRN